MISEAVLVAIIGALSIVLVALISAVLPLLFSSRKHARSASRDAAVVVEEVKNHHSKNLRVEADERHSENVDGIEEVKRLIRAQSRSSAARFRRLETRLGVVEHTIPKAPTTNRKRRSTK